jgi:tetratricopeptide (TPR) repeat protein
MLLWLFRTKERKILAILIGMIFLVGILLYMKDTGRTENIDQAVMAENFLKAGDYEKASDAYQRALSVKAADIQLLSIGLSDAYVGMKEYDKALEILRTCYQQTSGSRVKEKIEEVTADKIEYDYLQATTRAEVYYSNKEYDKAIEEYEKAKKIKSKEVTSYIRITQAYVEEGKYELAKGEAIEGKELTKDKVFDDLLASADSYLTKEQYDKLISQAQEYISQENYTDGISTYQEAVKLLPKEDAAYLELAQIYMFQKEYNKVIVLLQYAAQNTKNEELDRIMKKATQLQEKEEGN